MLPMLCMPIAGEVVAQKLGGGKEGADSPDAGGVERGPEAGAGVLGGSGAGEADFWRVQGVGTAEYAEAGSKIETIKKLIL